MEYDIQVRRRDNQGNIVMKTVLKGYSREHAKRIIKRAIEEIGRASCRERV